MAHLRWSVTRKIPAPLHQQVLGNQRALRKLLIGRDLLWPRNPTDTRRFIRGYGAAVALIIAVGLLGGCGSPARDDEWARVFQSVQDVPTGPYLELREPKAEHDSSNKASSSVASQSTGQTSGSNQSYSGPAAEKRFSSPPPSRSIPQPRQPQQVDPAEQLFQAMIIEGARRQQEEKEQQYQQFKRTMENAATCQACGGSGRYRFVDGSGVLRLQDCPYCKGSGRNW